MKKLENTCLADIQGGESPIDPCALALIYMVVSAVNGNYDGFIEGTILANNNCP